MLADIGGLTGMERAASVSRRFRIEKTLDVANLLVHSHVYEIHVWACDSLDNCGMSFSAPILVDLQPPVEPAALSIKPDRIGLDPRYPEVWALATRECTPQPEALAPFS